ncbi:MAG TPA: hypothetical protein ENK18_19975 [Deltaproteobacteria bacterium]|nr:hypothetical protein [Deltaproteobacteria bacterium]
MVLAMLVVGAAPAHAFDHTVGLRYRHGWVPRGLIDNWFFDIDDAGALPYQRPGIRVPMFGLEYTLALREDGGTAFVFWVERVGLKIDDGYWDDREEPPDHLDGTWVATDGGLGAWTIGANHLSELPLSPTTAPVWASVVLGFGVGAAVRTGDLIFWHSGDHPELIDPSCQISMPAPQRYSECPSDGTLPVPSALPILDLTLGTRVHLSEHATIRLEGGIHNVLYLGLSAGGSF